MILHTGWQLPAVIASTAVTWKDGGRELLRPCGHSSPSHKRFPESASLLEGAPGEKTIVHGNAVDDGLLSRPSVARQSTESIEQAEAGEHVLVVEGTVGQCALPRACVVPPHNRALEL